MQYHARLRSCPPPHGGRVEGGVRHGLGAPRQHDFGDPGLDLHGGVDHGLEARSATAVDLQSGHGDRQPGIEGGDPPDRRGVHRRVAVAEQDVVDAVGWETRPLEQRGDQRAGQRVGRDVAQ